MTVAVALLTYRDADGEHRTALRGEKIELDGAELDRAVRLEAVVEGDLDPAPGPVVEPTPPVSDDEAGVLNEDDDKAGRPTRGGARK